MADCCPGELCILIPGYEAMSMVPSQQCWGTKVLSAGISRETSTGWKPACEAWSVPWQCQIGVASAALPVPRLVNTDPKGINKCKLPSPGLPALPSLKAVGGHTWIGAVLPVPWGSSGPSVCGCDSPGTDGCHRAGAAGQHFS